MGNGQDKSETGSTNFAGTGNQSLTVTKDQSDYLSKIINKDSLKNAASTSNNEKTVVEHVPNENESIINEEAVVEETANENESINDEETVVQEATNKVQEGKLNVIS